MRFSPYYTDPEIPAQGDDSGSASFARNLGVAGGDIVLNGHGEPNGKLPWSFPAATEVHGAEAAEIRRTYEAEQAQPSAAGVGPNSGAQMPKDESGKPPPAWATPSKLTLDEAAKANVGTGRYAQERRTLLEAIADPRMGISPLARRRHRAHQPQNRRRLPEGQHARG